MEQDGKIQDGSIERHSVLSILLHFQLASQLLITAPNLPCEATLNKVLGGGKILIKKKLTGCYFSSVLVVLNR